MMNETLTDIFDQIINSEQLAQERNSHLQEVKSKIAVCEKNVEETKDERETLRGQLVLKVHHLNDKELEYKWLQSRRKILTENKEKLYNEIDELKKELDEVKDISMNKMTEFCLGVEQFSEQYDLLSTGKQKREKEMLDKIVKYEEEEKESAKDLECFEKDCLCIDELKTEKVKLEQELTTIKEQLRASMVRENETESGKSQGILKVSMGGNPEVLITRYIYSRTQSNEHLQKVNETLVTEENQLRILEEEREEKLHLPQKGEEFQRLQKELDELQSSHLESECQKLQQDIRNLQYQLRQQQIQKQQQQQQREHQQEVEKQYQKQSKQQFPEQPKNPLNSVTTQHSNEPQSKQVPTSTANRHCVSNFPVRKPPTIHNIRKESTASSSPDILSHVFDDDLSLPDIDDTNMSDDSSTNPSTPDVSSNTLDSPYQTSNAPRPIFKLKYKKN